MSEQKINRVDVKKRRAEGNYKRIKRSLLEVEQSIKRKININPWDETNYERFETETINLRDKSEVLIGESIEVNNLRKWSQARCINSENFEKSSIGD